MYRPYDEFRRPFNDGGLEITRRGSAWLGVLILGMGVLLAGAGLLVVGQYSSGAQAQELTSSETTLASNLQRIFTVNVPAVFRELVTIAALEVEGESIFGGPVTFQGGSVFDGEITLQGDIIGSGVNIDVGSGEITASNILYSVTAGSGISISEGQTPTITNSDRGSSQSIFKKIKLGDDTADADANDDTLEFSAGSGISLSLDTSNDKLTITNSAVPGFVKSGTYAVFASGVTRVGIGTSTPGNTVEISSETSGASGLTFTNLTSASSVGSGGGKVLSVDSGGNVILVTDESGSAAEGDLDTALPGGSTGSTIYFDGSSWAHSTNLYHDGGQIGISTIPGTNIRFDVKTNSTTAVGMVIRRVSSQTANLLQFRNESDAVLSYFDADGVFNGQIAGSGSFNPGFTTGSVAFQGASGLTQDNANFFWDDTNDRLGIGTSSPVSSLQIYSTDPNIYITDGTGSYQANQGGSIYFGQQGSNAIDQARIYGFTRSGNGGILAFYTSGGTVASTERMRIDHAGNVGIGTTSPGAKLHVSGGTIALDNNQYLQWKDVATGAFQNIMKYGNSDAVTITSPTTATVGSGALTLQGNNNTALQTAGGRLELKATQVSASAYIALTTGASERLRVTNDGNVGIGTTNPSASLQIGNSISDTGTQVMRIAAPAGGTGTVVDGLHIDTSNAGTYDQGVAISLGYKNSTNGEYTSRIVHYGNQATTRASKLQFQTHSVTAGVWNTGLLIDNVGNVGIGTTSPGAKLEVVDALRIGSTNIIGTSDEFAQLDFYSNDDSTNAQKVAAAIRARSGSVGGWSTANHRADLAFYTIVDGSTGLTEKMTLLGGGNLGLGTTTPGSSLPTSWTSNAADRLIEIHSQSAAHNAGLFLRRSDLATGLDLWANNNSGNVYIDNRYNDSASAMYFRTRTQGTAVNAMTILGSGNVGIGTSSPASKLDLYTGSNTTGLTLRGAVSTAEIADIYIRSSGELTIDNTVGTDTSGYIDLRSKDDQYGIVIRESDGSGSTTFANLYVVDNGSADYLNINVNNAQASTGLVVNQSGNVGIGTTSPGNGSPATTRLLQVNGPSDGSTTGISVRNNNTLTQGFDIWYDGSSAKTYFDSRYNDTFGDILFRNRTSGTPVDTLTLKATGNVGIGTTSPAYKFQVNTLSANTAYLGDVAQQVFALRNTDSTNNNWTVMNFLNSSSVQVASIGVQNVDNTNGYGALSLGTKGADGYLQRLTINQNGSLVFNDSGNSSSDFRIEGDTDTNLFFADASADKVGIGTASPNAKLSLGSTSGDKLDLWETGGNRYGFGIQSGLLQMYVPTTSDSIGFGVGSSSSFTQGVTILGSGSVGIGDTTPTEGKLTINHASGVGLHLTNSSTGIGLHLANTAADGDPRIAFDINGGGVWNIGANDGDADKFMISSDGSGTLDNNVRLTIDTSGNVGIGTTSPGARLSVVNTANATALTLTANATQTNPLMSVFKSDGTSTLSQLYPHIAAGGAGSAYIFDTAADITTTKLFELRNNGTAVLTVQNGNVGIGTSTFGTSAAKVLAIAGSTAPSTAITDGVQLFAVDQSGSHELRVMDEAGNTTTLSPHNFSIVGDQSEEMAWSFYSERNALAINADMAKAMRLVEKLSGEKIIYLKDLETGTYLEDESDATKITELAINGIISDIAKWNYDAWTFVGTVVFEKPVTFLASVRANGPVWLGGRVTFADKDMAGFATIPASGTRVEVVFENAFAQAPVITVSPKSAVKLDWFRVTEESPTGFVIEISTAQAEDVVFSWTALAVEEAGATVGQPAVSPAPSVTPTPSPTETPATPAPSTASGELHSEVTDSTSSADATSSAQQQE